MRYGFVKVMAASPEVRVADTVYNLEQAKKSFDAAENVIEAIELGATTVMLGSALLGGYGIITETVRRLEEWLEKNGYGDIGALRGAALQYLRSYEELHER